MCRDGAKVLILVPHPRHDDYLCDPTHVRPVLPEGLALFSQKANRKAIAGGFSNTPLGMQLQIDFDVVGATRVPAPFYAKALKSGQMTRQQLDVAGERWNNVFKEVRILLSAVKPAGRA